jgi:hypothetical protein
MLKPFGQVPNAPKVAKIKHLCYYLCMEKHPDLIDQIDSLEQTFFELAAIKQAAKDFVNIVLDEHPLRLELKNGGLVEYDNLKQLLNGENN